MAMREEYNEGEIRYNESTNRFRAEHKGLLLGEEFFSMSAAKEAIDKQSKIAKKEFKRIPILRMRADGFRQNGGNFGDITSRTPKEFWTSWKNPSGGTPQREKYYESSVSSTYAGIFLDNEGNRVKFNEILGYSAQIASLQDKIIEVKKSMDKIPAYEEEKQEAEA